MLPPTSTMSQFSPSGTVISIVFDRKISSLKPTRLFGVLYARVELLTVASPTKLRMPPPSQVAVFSLIVELNTNSDPRLSMPLPHSAVLA